MTIGRSMPMNGMIRLDVVGPHTQNEFSRHKKRDAVSTASLFSQLALGQLLTSAGAFSAGALAGAGLA
ncbi:hypothetical protein ALO36_103725 [Pseudomonas syringae pv. tomato]|uniref:Uncharacterized protein n=4 Tax=Pseudomonas syringae group TaxID=136849 RepID=A0A0Q0A449_PSESX|nr:hypothetical protein ALO87_102359 [Pseudomonas syringae pv. apii]KPW49197.1 hypothetical protein ALO86_102074 [Pseudomonas syringae pv. berberidis]KPX72875.1 hypothetical protein ALO84_102111 [Pseudomonas syringae pv. maculicola]KPY28875.1 hypothetical protein ALO54_102338 [Pseudomonas syringae pv. philadelphi]KPY56086.1 hypothetical protein ALO94_100955 [Pseudomonas syringae pv. spinaceae]KPY90169.1 hypothetical protein ALO36_103725 [Pseudomonas syringae pv. tomato]RMM13681.1 hypothetical